MKLSDLFNVNVTVDPQPAADPAQPAADPAQPAADPAQPAADPAQPAADPAQPAADPAQPAADPAKDNYLTRDEFTVILKKELTELVKDLQAVNREKPVAQQDPASFTDILKKHYEE